MKEFLQLAHDRYSVRKFSDKPVEKEKLEKIIEAGKAAPTAVNFQPFKLFVFENKESIEKLSQAHHFAFAKNIPAVIIVGSDSTKSWKRQFDGLDYANIDAAIVATHIMLEIHDLGLGSTWCGHFDQAKVKELFPETEGYNLIAMFPIGYIADDAEPSKTHFVCKAEEDIIKRFA